MALGILTTAMTGVPSNVDLAALNTYQTAEAVGMGDVLGFVRPAAQQFGNFNWAGLEDMAAVLEYILAPSPDDRLSWRDGILTGQRVTRDLMGGPPNQHRTRSGAQVPDVRFLAALPGYTWEVLRGGRDSIRRAEVEGDILAALETHANDMWSEALRSVAVKAARTTIDSTTGKGVGWLGATSQNHTVGRRKGTDLSSTSHYLSAAGYADSAAGRLLLFQDQQAALELQGFRHQSSAPILLLHGNASLSDVKLVTGYAAPTAVGVTPGGGSTAAVVTDVPVWAHGKWTGNGAWCVDMGTALPEHYYVMLKSYGPRNPRNPVRLFYPSDVGFGPLLMDMRDNPHPVDGSTALDLGLLANMALWLQYGMAVQTPEAGVAGYINGGAWSDPTIT